MIIFFHSFDANNPWSVVVPIAVFALTALANWPRWWGSSYGGDDGGSGLFESLFNTVQNLFSYGVVAVLLGLAAFSFFRQVRDSGLAAAFNFGPAATARAAGRHGGGANGRGGGTRGRRLTRRHSASDRRSAVEAAIRVLPMQCFYTRSELSAMSVPELKAKAKELSVDVRRVVEKRDLVGALCEAGGSSGSSCSCCLEDYDSGDMLRLLPCGHRFHVECVDRWFLTSSTSYSRQPACPMCNAPLLQE